MSRDDRIVIRNADKGGAVVVLDSYRNQAICQLSDSNTYLKLRGDSTPLFKKRFVWVVRAVKAGIFTSQERDVYL